MYRTFSLHRFSLCSGLNVVGHVDSVLDSVMELLSSVLVFCWIFVRLYMGGFLRHFTCADLSFDQ